MTQYSSLKPKASVSLEYKRAHCPWLTTHGYVHSIKFVPHQKTNTSAVYTIICLTLKHMSHLFGPKSVNIYWAFNYSTTWHTVNKICLFSVDYLF